MSRQLKLGLSICLLLCVGCEYQSPIPVPAMAAPTTTSSTLPTPPATIEEPPSAAEPKSETFDPDLAKRAVVRIDFLRGSPLGYGVIVDKSSTGFDVLTADHVVGSNRDLVIQTWTVQGGNEQLKAHFNVSVMSRDPVKDLAWLRVKSSDFNVSTLQLASVKEANLESWPGWCYRDDRGQPEFVSMEVAQRSRAKRSEGDSAVSYWELKEKVDPGMSGGPLLTQEGQWVGIASGNSQARAYYVDELEIRQFMQLVGLR